MGDRRACRLHRGIGEGLGRWDIYLKPCLNGINNRWEHLALAMKARPLSEHRTGIWICKKVEMSRIKKILEAPNSDYAARGAPTQATQGCGFYNVYLSRLRPVKGWMAVKIDTRCRHCNRRVRFQPARQDARGRPSPVYTLIDYWGMEPEFLIEMANNANRGEQRERDNIGFVRAKNYRVV